MKSGVEDSKVGQDIMEMYAHFLRGGRLQQGTVVGCISPHKAATFHWHSKNVKSLHF